MEGMKLKGSAELINKKAKFRCTVEEKQDIITDYTPPLGDGEGHTSLELLLLSLSSCFASSVKFLLMREKIKVDELKVNAEGERREEHPTGFKNISLFILIKAEGLKSDILEKVIRLSEENICPVYSMIKGNTLIDVKYSIVNAEGK
jgi:putative redox protein